MTAPLEPMPLPEPEAEVVEGYFNGSRWIRSRRVKVAELPVGGLFTEEQLLARDAAWASRLEAAVAAERERCAKVVEDAAWWHRFAGEVGKDLNAARYAAAIRGTK